MPNRLFQPAQKPQPLDLSGITALLAAIYDEVRLPSSPQIMNIPIQAANTEQKISLPPAVKSFTIKARGGAIQIAFAQGDTTQNYILLTDGQSFTQDKIKTKDLYIYTLSAATPYVEVIYWL